MQLNEPSSPGCVFCLGSDKNWHTNFCTVACLVHPLTLGAETLFCSLLKQMQQASRQALGKGVSQTWCYPSLRKHLTQAELKKKLNKMLSSLPSQSPTEAYPARSPCSQEQSVLAAPRHKRSTRGWAAARTDRTPGTCDPHGKTALCGVTRQLAASLLISPTHLIVLQCSQSVFVFKCLCT